MEGIGGTVLPKVTVARAGQVLSKAYTAGAVGDNACTLRVLDLSCLLG